MDKNILEYFTQKYNTNDLKWFFDMLPDDVRSYEKAFEITRKMYDKKLVA